MLVNSEVVNDDTEEKNNESKGYVNLILPFAWLNMFGMQTTEAIYLHQFLHRCAPSQKILSVDTCGDIHCISYTKDSFSFRQRSVTEILGTQVLQGKFNQKYPLAFEDDICYEKLIEPYLSPMLCHEIN